MAATLVEGQKYGLNSNNFISGNKTVIHFKLTDSALRALEEFSHIKEGCSRTPTIQFTDNSGVMSIPVQVSSDNPKAERHFHLNLAKIAGDANGSFDCIQQTRTRYGTGLSCLGSMQYKVSTNANSDVYSDTRKKFAIADSESKKICAKEIKVSSRFSGKNIKKVIPSSQYKALNPSKPASSSSSSVPPHSSSSSSRHHPPSSSLLSSSSSSSALLSQSSTSSRLPTPTNSPPTLVGEGRSSGSTSQPSSGKPTSLVTSSNGILKIGNSTGGKQSTAINLPARDRVIHLLAVRHLGKPELLYKLMKDGIHSTDRDSVDSILKSISVHHRDNYHLAKHAWQFFRPDWPLYTETERSMAKRNRQAAESRSSTSPSEASPVVRPSDSPSPPQKRALEDPLELVVASKKQRTGHHRHRQPPPTTSITHPHQQTKLPNGTTTRSHPHPSSSSYSRHHRTSGGGSTGSLSGGSDVSSVDSVGTAASGGSSSGASDKDSPLPESPGSNCENQEKGEDQDSSLLDYLLQYTQIESCAQRQSYKEDFNREYAEYRQLHDKVQDVSRRFQALKERIDNTKEGSQTYEELRHQVLEEYHQQKSDGQFQRHKQRVDYLHAKLSHIKQLILSYDQHCHAQQCS